MQNPSKQGLLGPSVDPAARGWLTNVAVLDPRLAVAVLGGLERVEQIRDAVRGDPVKKAGSVGAAGSAVIRPDMLGWGEPSCGWGLEHLNIRGTFSSGECDSFINAKMDDPPTTSEMWVRKITYTVKRPNAFAGNIFKAQSDYYNRLNPNIDFTLLINSYCKYVIAPDPTPLENIEEVFECVCPIGFVLGCATNITSRMVLTRDYSTTDGEIPAEVVITLSAVRLPTSYGACSIERAVEALTSCGIL